MANEPRQKGRSEAELDAFMRAINRRSVSGKRIYLLALMMRYTGMRVGEALALHPEDVDFESRRINVLRGKTHAAERTVMMPGDDLKVAELHEAYIAWMLARRELGTELPEVFVSSSGEKPLDYNSVGRSFARVSKRGGLTRKVMPHQMRHTYASVLIGKGAPITGVARQLGHKNPAITMRVYSWVVGTEQEDAVSRY